MILIYKLTDRFCYINAGCQNSVGYDNYNEDHKSRNLMNAIVLRIFVDQRCSGQNPSRVPSQAHPSRAVELSRDHGSVAWRGGEILVFLAFYWSFFCEESVVNYSATCHENAKKSAEFPVKSSEKGQYCCNFGSAKNSQNTARLGYCGLGKAEPCAAPCWALPCRCSEPRTRYYDSNAVGLRTE